MGKLIFILGGARSGKSSFAMQLARKKYQRVCYLATAQALDAEMQARISTHKKERPANWKTLEIPTHIAAHLNDQIEEFNLVVLDCLTLLLSNVIMENCGYNDDPDVERAAEAVDIEISSILQTIQVSRADWIVVSNEVGLGLVPPNPLGRLYRDLLGMANQKFVQIAQESYYLVAGVPIPLSKFLTANYPDTRD